MRLKKFGLGVVATFGMASLSVASSALSPAVAGNDRTRHIHGVTAAHHRYFDGYRPLYGYYTRHGQYVPGAGDRLIYGPGYVFVPGRGILDEACNLPSSTCTNEYRDVR
jgi:hypothetical protein